MKGGPDNVADRAKLLIAKLRHVLDGLWDSDLSVEDEHRLMQKALRSGGAIDVLLGLATQMAEMIDCCWASSVTIGPYRLAIVGPDESPAHGNNIQLTFIAMAKLIDLSGAKTLEELTSLAGLDVREIKAKAEQSAQNEARGN